MTWRRAGGQEPSRLTGCCGIGGSAGLITRSGHSLDLLIPQTSARSAPHVAVAVAPLGESPEEACSAALAPLADCEGDKLAPWLGICGLMSGEVECVKEGP